MNYNVLDFQPLVDCFNFVFGVPAPELVIQTRCQEIRRERPTSFLQGWDHRPFMEKQHCHVAKAWEAAHCSCADGCARDRHKRVAQHQCDVAKHNHERGHHCESVARKQASHVEADGKKESAEIIKQTKGHVAQIRKHAHNCAENVMKHAKTHAQNVTQQGKRQYVAHHKAASQCDKAAECALRQAKKACGQAKVALKYTETEVQHTKQNAQQLAKQIHKEQTLLEKMEQQALKAASVADKCSNAYACKIAYPPKKKSR